MFHRVDQKVLGVKKQPRVEQNREGGYRVRPVQDEVPSKVHLLENLHQHVEIQVKNKLPQMLVLHLMFHANHRYHPPYPHTDPNANRHFQHRPKRQN